MKKNKKESGMLTRSRKRPSGIYGLPLLISLLLVFAIGGTIAYLHVKSETIKNKFDSSSVSCEVTEDFDGTTKTNVNVKNTSDIAVYVRVKLVSYRVNGNGEHIGGTAEIGSFTLGNGWVYQDGYYYYTEAVAAGESPAANLIDSLSLTASYADSDEGSQVIEVMAEAIQAEGTTTAGVKAVVAAWGVDPTALTSVADQ